jgi:hypothetical protein
MIPSDGSYPSDVRMSTVPKKQTRINDQATPNIHDHIMGSRGGDEEWRPPACPIGGTGEELRADDHISRSRGRRRVASADMPDRWDRGRTTSGRAWKTTEANRKPFRFRHGDQEWVKKCDV